MSMDMQNWLQALRNPVPTRRRDSLTQLENLAPDDIAAFAQQAQDVDVSIALDLCNVLSGATRQPLVNLLGAWAMRKHPGLREQALRALSVVPAAPRRQCLRRLLDAPEAKIRAEACRLLGEAGGQSSRNLLLDKLADPAPAVPFAALEALDRLQITDATQAIQRCLSHGSSSVRDRAIRALVTLARGRAFPTSTICKHLEEDASLEVKLAACWALEKRPSPEAQPLLLSVLENARDTSLRVAAATALVSYPQDAVIEQLMHATVNDATPAVALACGRTMRQMPEDLVIRVAHRLLPHAEPMVRMEAASMLSGLGYESVCQLLIERLDSEPDDVVRAALIEALGHVGRLEAWDPIYALVEKDPIVAYPAMDALAELMDHEHAEAFAAILSKREEVTLREAVLRRLAIYGRANGLPRGLFDRLKGFFSCDDSKLALLALQAARHMHEEGDAVVVLQAIESLQDDAALEAAALTALHLADDSVFTLYQTGGPERLSALNEVLRRLDEIDDSAPQLLRQLALQAAKGTTGAQACLDATVRLSPESLLPVLEQAEPEAVEVLLGIWHELPSHLQRRAPVDLTRLLQSESALVRTKCLSIIEAPVADKVLFGITDLAITDSDPAVQERATDLLGKLLTA